MGVNSTSVGATYGVKVGQTNEDEKTVSVLFTTL